MSLTGNALNNSNEKRFKIVYTVTLVIFFAVCTVLYQRMTISYPGVFGTYYSDINVRLAMHEINGGSIYYTYSIFLIPERWFYFVLGKPVGPWCIGVYLSFFTVGTVFILFQLLKKLCPEAKTGRCCPASGSPRRRRASAAENRGSGGNPPRRPADGIPVEGNGRNNVRVPPQDFPPQG